MTRGELADRLDHLDPGATFTIDKDTLARIFDEVMLSESSHDALKAISAFALEHRCTFSFHRHAGPSARFEKEDIF